LGEHASDFATLATHAGNFHVVVSGRLVAHPSDDGCFGAFFDGDSFGSGDGSAPDRGRVVGDRLGQILGRFQVTGMEIEKAKNGGFKAFHVGFLLAFAPSLIGLLPLGVSLRSSLLL
jgi:hypothetical protein